MLDVRCHESVTEASSVLHTALRRGRRHQKWLCLAVLATHHGFQRSCSAQGRFRMTGKSILLAGAALTVLAAFPAVAQQQSLEDRIRALEQKLGQPAPSDNQPLEDRVKALEEKINQKTEDD